MVGGGGAAELRGEFFGGFAGGSVDDGGAVGFFAEELCGELVAAGLGEFDNLNGEVVAAEAVDEEFGSCELELGDDVFLYCWCGCGCERDDRGGPEGGEEVAESTVVGPKSWPQAEMQWASSMAMSEGFFFASISGKLGRACARAR